MIRGAECRSQFERSFGLAVAMLAAAACTPVGSLSERAAEMDGSVAPENPTDGSAGTSGSGGGGTDSGSAASGAGGNSTGGGGSGGDGGDGSPGGNGGNSAGGGGSGGNGGDGSMSQGGSGGSGGTGGSAGSPEPAAMCGDGQLEGTEVCDGNCPTMEQCKADDACLAPMLTGSAATCDARCDTVAITQCVKGDGCCPEGCKYPADDDCSKSCGDGAVDAPETCEPTSATKPCPTSCDDSMPSTKDVLTGSATQCSARCTHTPITMPMNGDKYCPPGANANNDNDCTPMCGNRVKEMGEDCDGNCPTSCPRPSDACTVNEVQGTGCAVKCVERKLTASSNGTDGCCPSSANATTDSDCVARCGNNVKEDDELCDGNCPTSCSQPSDRCIRNELQGSGCQTRCVERRLTASTGSKDMCCPSGANATTDSDCTPVCGNDVTEAGERCDASCPTSCADPAGECVDAVLRDARTCTARCETVNVPASGMTKDGKCCGSNGAQDADCPSTCGNGIQEPGEECDSPTSITCENCKNKPTYTYPRCLGEPFTEDPSCPKLPGGQIVMCTAYQMCAPVCNDMTFFCPVPSNGPKKPECAIACQFHCTSDTDCPGNSHCRPDGFCGYTDTLPP
jgi:hypothetical protein